MLVEDMANARLVDANSIIELRLKPERLTGEISEFVDSCWKPSRATRAKRAKPKGKGRAPASGGRRARGAAT